MQDYRTQSYRERTASISRGEQTSYEKRKGISSASTIKDYDVSINQGVVTYNPRELSPSQTTTPAPTRPNQSVVDLFRGTKTSELSPQEAGRISQMSLREDVKGYYVSRPDETKGFTPGTAGTYLDVYKGEKGFYGRVGRQAEREQTININKNRLLKSLGLMQTYEQQDIKLSSLGSSGIGLIKEVGAFPVNIVAGTLVVGGRVAMANEAAVSSLWSRDDRGKVVYKAWGEVPKAVATQFNPTTTAGIVNIAFASSMVKSTGATFYKQFKAPKAGAMTFSSYESMGTYKVEGGNVKVNVVKSGVIKQEVISGLDRSYRYFDVVGGGKEAGMIFQEGGRYRFQLTSGAVVSEFKPGFTTSQLGLYDMMPKNYLKSYYSFETGKGGSVLTGTGGFGNIQRNTLIYELGKGKGFEPRTLRIAGNKLGVNIESSKMIYNSKPFVSQNVFDKVGDYGFKYVESGKAGTSVSYGKRLLEVEGVKPGVTTSYRSVYNPVLDLEMVGRTYYNPFLGRDMISGQKIIYADLSKTRMPKTTELRNVNYLKLRGQGTAAGYYKPFSDKIVLSKKSTVYNPLFRDSNINVFYHEMAHANFAERGITPPTGIKWSTDIAAELFKGRIEGKPSVYRYQQVRGYYRSLGYESRPASLINEELVADLSSRYITNLKAGRLSELSNIPKTRATLGNYYGNYAEANLVQMAVVKQSNPVPVKAGVLYQQSIGLSGIELTGFRRNVASALRSGSSKVDFGINNKIIKTGLSNKPIYEQTTSSPGGGGSLVQQMKIKTSSVSEPAVGSSIDFEGFAGRTTKTIVQYRTEALPKTKVMFVPLRNAANERMPSLSSKISPSMSMLISPVSQLSFTPAISTRSNVISKIRPVQMVVPSQVQRQELGISSITTGFSPSPITPPPSVPIIPIPFFQSGGQSATKNYFKSFGGGRATKYVPSFTALFYKETGSYKPGRLSKTGFDYRPITKGYRLTGPINVNRFSVAAL